MTALQPVRHGTADQLAILHYLRGTGLPDAHQLTHVARFLLGTVTNPDEVLDQCADDLELLWRLLGERWSDRDLDELTDADWEKHSFSSRQQETEHRWTLTVDRVVYDIETHIHLHRLIHAENARKTRAAARAPA